MQLYLVLTKHLYYVSLLYFTLLYAQTLFLLDRIKNTAFIFKFLLMIGNTFYKKSFGPNKKPYLKNNSRIE